MTERLDKFLSTQTMLSRSEIKKHLAHGKGTVNGKVVWGGNRKIDPEKDEITIFGKIIEYRNDIYIILNKPEGIVCATKDPRDKTVTDILPQELQRKDIFPAGRLDKDSLGMVFITNDGTLSHKILSPKKHIPKYYLVKLAKPFKNEYVDTFNKGMEIDGGEKCLPAHVRQADTLENTAFVELLEGKFHQVKRMFSAVENHVEKLMRIQMGSLAMPAELGVGEHMELLHKDVENLVKITPFDEVFEKRRPFFPSYLINNSL